jgi:hypothetical protein
MIMAWHDKERHGMAWQGKERKWHGKAMSWKGNEI